MRAGWVRAAALSGLVAISCGSVHNVAQGSRTASASRGTPSSTRGDYSPPPSTTTPTSYPPPTTASSTRTQCHSVQPAPQFASSAPSNRNLAIVQLKGSNTYVVRDLTDIVHPFTIATFEAIYVSPQFVSASDVSFVDATGLVRMRLAGASRTTITDCTELFAWSPDGTTLAYVSSIEQLHLVGNGQDHVAESMPTWPGGYGCESQGCADSWEFHLLYSPNGAFISMIQWPPGLFRIWTSDGKIVTGSDFRSPGPTETMSVWSGNTLYFRDGKGVEMWRDRSETLLLPGIAWIRPHAASSGGQIVYETRDPDGTAHVYLLDTSSGKVRALAKSRSEPAFLNSHLIWYQGERQCMPSDKCFAGPSIPTGKTYIYDLQDSTETGSKIAAVFDVWPHPA
jgi:hypothetical protein